MKVGTDGVLLGAWAELPPAGTVLDVGCGCGLIALMAAQRMETFAEGAHGEAAQADRSFRITGIDIDKGSIQDATENFAASPWCRHLQAVHADFPAYAATLSAASVDAILSNPPYFSEDLLSPHARRNLSRHAGSLPFEALLTQAQRLLKPGGTLAMVLPPRAYAQIESLLPQAAPHLRLQRCTQVCFKEGKACERVLAQWRNRPADYGHGAASPEVLARGGTPANPGKAVYEAPLETTLTLQNPQGIYTSAYRTLVEDFYLWA